MAYTSPQGPLLGQQKVDKLLTQVSIMYRNESYIAELIAPTVSVPQKTGIVPKFGKENLKVNKGQGIRAPGQRAVGFNYSVDITDKYACFEHAFEKQIPWELYNNVDDPYDPKRDATNFATDLMLQNQEYAMASAMGDSTILTNGTALSGGSRWDQVGSSDPVADINNAITAVRLKIARRPNSITMSLPVLLTFKNHPKVREQMKYTNGGQPSDEDAVTFMKNYFKLKFVFIGEAVGDLTIEGQDPSLTDLWGKFFVVHYTTPTPTLMTPTFAYTFFDIPRFVDTYTIEAEKADYARIQYSYDQHICDLGAAYLTKTVIN